MSQKRSKDQLIAQILTTCQGDDASKTKIVYQVNLNFHTAKVHLDLLQKNGLVEAIPDYPVMHKTTPKGEKALECLAVIEEIYS
ncbi:MAG: winged helix-turn-helix domain-containing protein [Methanothrix sp.]